MYNFKKKKFTKDILALETGKTVDLITIGNYSLALQRGTAGNYRVWTNGSISVKYENGIIANNFRVYNKQYKKELYRLFWELELLDIK
jgi:hypothetical protein